MERRQFTEEFKREAVKLARQPGASKAGFSRCAICPCLPAAFSSSSALTSSIVEKKRTRLPCRPIASTPKAVARCVLPVPGPQ